MLQLKKELVKEFVQKISAMASTAGCKVGYLKICRVGCNIITLALITEMISFDSLQRFFKKTHS